MHARSLHLHSMLVHSVLAFVPLAAIACLLESGDVSLGGFDAGVWRFLVRTSLLVVALVSVPATLSGVLERRHLYVTWHRTHAVKLWLSLALLLAVVWELGTMLASDDNGALLVAAVVVGNVALAGVLSAYGLKMSLGRQSLAGTSYAPDMLRQPPVDIVAAAAAHLAVPADVIDVMGEA